ncbi:type 4a pilus biogenesis protein PilO [Paenibacillus sp. 7124]|uniref:Type 4a pilus biogenesis protein PilO n=1 Tax=Paenibacillus apii TaxID=1850370 RepID=A0A6M1PPW0_9BACL|nr:type 4a pilus biogenesis protein PilO [Paenibacillus apii]NGM82341.1 type 4a pilus biogenesis protein PilO [Paenibacillus apii]NJJ39478.1 type 4a pilus biogenesis protein PilO [Paenibacillus apii]
MEQINKYRSPIVLGVLILFLMLLAFYLLGLQPASRKISEQEAQLAQLNEQNQLLQSQIDKLQSSSPGAEEKESLLAQLPRGDNSEQLILDLRAIGTMTSARLKDISFTAGNTNPIQEMTGASTAAYPTVKALKMTAIVEGDYTSIRNWMKALQMLPRIINVDSFVFQRSSAKNPGAAQSMNSILTATVSFTAYYEEADQDKAGDKNTWTQSGSDQTALAGQ